MKIPLTFIIIEDRQRRDTGDIESLAESLREQGQISPILVKPCGPNWRLVAGGRRCAAANLSNWTSIEAVDRVTIDDKIVLVADLTPLQLQILEYEENVRRKDLSWQESCLSVSKLHMLKQIEHGFSTKGTGTDAWTERKMADFTGYARSYVHYMLAIARELAVTPPSEIWKCTGYTDAVAFLIRRMEAEANAELERRRQRNNPTLIATEAGQPLAASAALEQSSTEEAPKRDVIYLHGVPKAFEDCVPDEDFMTGVLSCILGFNVRDGKCLLNVMRALCPTGYLVLWNSENPALPQMPGAIVWNQVAGFADDQSPWPFTQNYLIGRVYTPTPPTIPCVHHYSATISCVPDHPTDLHSSVVDFSITPFALDGMAVTVLGDVNPLHIAELGRVPIWYEPDPAKYAAKCDALRAFYEANIPNIEVRTKA